MKQLTLALPCEFIKGYQSKSYTDSPSRMPKLGIIVTTSLDSSYTLLGLHKGASVIYTCLHTHIYIYTVKRVERHRLLNWSINKYRRVPYKIL